MSGERDRKVPTELAAAVGNGGVWRAVDLRLYQRIAWQTE